MRQFVQGEVDGPVPFHVHSEAYRDDLKLESEERNW